MSISDTLRLPSGVWVPSGNYGKRYFKNALPGGFSTHCLPHLEEITHHLPKHRRLTAIDGGAYVGIWSMHLVRMFARVLAFEPVSMNVRCLKRNVAPVECSFEVIEAALSDRTGINRLFDTGKAYGQRIPLFGELGTQVIATVRVDDFNIQDLDLLKLDVEGHEFFALLGASETIKKCRPLVMIEEKLNETKRAYEYLIDMGMRLLWKKKHDYLFGW